MENYVNRFIFTKWLHKDGFQQRWLRRINRQTDTQYVSDCQRTLTGKRDCFDKKKFYDCATRFKVGKNSGKLIELGRKNPDGKLSVALVEDMSQIDCDMTYEEFLAEIDALNKKAKDEMQAYFRSVRLSEPKTGKSDIFKDLFTPYVKHLKELFGEDITVLKISHEHVFSTTHDNNKLAQNAVHYHITVHGGEADTITFEEDRNNSTIVFWKFGKTIVFDFASGIGSW